MLLVARCCEECATLESSFLFSIMKSFITIQESYIELCTTKAMLVIL
jgi:hypothetical protein